MKLVDQSLAEVRDFILQKAAEKVSTSTFSPASRSIFSPENLDEKIKLAVPTRSGAILRMRLPRVKGIGQAAAWKKMTSKLHSNVDDSGTATTIFFADAGAPSETTQTYSASSAAYKLLGRKLEVGGLAIAASRGRDGQPDHMTERLVHKMTEVLLGEEEAIIHGDVDNDANGFDGILKQITTTSGTVTYLTASGVQTHCKTIFDKGGSPTLLLANSAQGQYLADDLQGASSIQRIIANQQGDATGGIALTTIVNAIDGTQFDFRTSRYMHKTALLLTEKSPVIPGEINPMGNVIEMDDLIPLSRVDIPSSNYSNIAFIVEATVCKVFAENWQVQLTTST